jgi:hypothetical protein
MSKASNSGLKPPRIQDLTFITDRGTTPLFAQPQGAMAERPATRLFHRLATLTLTALTNEIPSSAVFRSNRGGDPALGGEERG